MPRGADTDNTTTVGNAAFTLSKRASRAYNAMWSTPQLPTRAQWRALVWIAVQLPLVVMVKELRDVVKTSVALALLAAALIIVVWFAAEVLTQTLTTRGQVARPRILLAASFATVGLPGRPPAAADRLETLEHILRESRR